MVSHTKCNLITSMNPYFIITISVLTFLHFTTCEQVSTLAPTKPLTLEVVTTKPTFWENGNAKNQMKAADLKAENPTRTPEKKELSSKTSTTQMAPSFSATLYKLESDNSGACILFRVDAVVAFNYSTKHGDILDRELYVPKDAEITGDCSKGDDSVLFFKWNTGFVLSWFFSKTPGGERWFVDRVELRYDSSDRHFEHIKKPEKLTLSTPRTHGSLLFPTPVGQAYTCDREIPIKLTNKATDTVAILLLRELKVQPFIFKDDFGPEYICPALGAGLYQSETVPLIVGSILAAACLFTVTGYGIFRYFKIKKVQYDTME